MKTVCNLLILLFFLNYICFPSYALGSKESISSNNYDNLIKLADKAFEHNDMKTAINYYSKAIQIKPDFKILYKLGVIYESHKDYNNSLKYFQMALEFAPDNAKIKKRVEDTIKFVEDINKYKLSSPVEPKERAPFRIHSLIEVKCKLKDPETEEKLDKIIDLIWSDREGRKLLQAVLDCQIPIRIINTGRSSHVLHYNGILPLAVSYKYSIPDKFSVYMATLNILEVHIINFQTESSDLINDEVSIMVVAHELCHLIGGIKFTENKMNSKEEELIATMIGCNIASRILTGKPISEFQAKQIAYQTIKSLNAYKEYKVLPTYSGFATKMIELGFELPHYKVYSDLDKITP